MRQKLHSFFIGGRHFKEEFRRQLRLLVIVTIGFTIAFSWRQTIFDAIQVLIQTLTGINGLPSSVSTSITITIISLIIIYITSQILKEHPDKY